MPYCGVHYLNLQSCCTACLFFYFSILSIFLGLTPPGVHRAQRLEHQVDGLALCGTMAVPESFTSFARQTGRRKGEVRGSRANSSPPPPLRQHAVGARG